LIIKGFCFYLPVLVSNSTYFSSQKELITSGFNTFGINIEDLPQGLYILTIFSDNKDLKMSKKLIKNEE